MALYRQHERALTKIVTKIVDAVLNQENSLQSDIDLARAAEDSIDKLARIQDLSSRRYQTKIIKREIKKILRDSNNLLVATIVDIMKN